MGVMVRGPYNIRFDTLFRRYAKVEHVGRSVPKQMYVSVMPNYDLVYFLAR